ncbi:hypothetical protein M501DRAFT_1028456 [Patellaria atrata CBS 101060]|uniref:Phosphatidate phosphatase APP1 catalytic domain-containing protein n=1 Tax=Patellaria atrata CBS 101060 TaxID=1346257 RepID=A0A9P4SJ80_9PEZI|nr:hypothetical protein M501DRAFT_1028456 [Patellaria atrata CBS 101060]
MSSPYPITIFTLPKIKAAAELLESNIKLRRLRSYITMNYPTLKAFGLQAQQHIQETQGEHEARKTAGFPEFEATMPFLPTRSGSLSDNLSSYLGKRNPFYRNVEANKHTVWLFDNTASRPAPNKPWQAEFVAAYFIKSSGRDVSTIVADIAEKIGIAKGDKAEATIAERIQPLLDTICPAHSVTIDAVGAGIKRLGPSSRDGVSNDIIQLRGDFADGHTAISDATISVTPQPMTTTFADATGWAVISDVDDTIKKTMTASPVGILKTTFADDPEPIAGMPELYKYVVQKLDNPPFWYLSASPYNLYTFLRSFRETYYPPGTLLLREASWWNLAGFLASLTQGTQAYKVDNMEKIHKDFPKRKFLCIGDSTQSDPETYGEMARRHPGWIGGIFIRRVQNVTATEGNDQNHSERFEKAFKDVPTNIWHVFDDPSELYDWIDNLLAA